MVRYLSWFLSIWFLYWLTQGTQATILSATFLTIQGARLENNVMKESESSSSIECAHLCLSDQPSCKSINFEIKGGRSRRKCQLNNATKSLQPENLRKNESFNYFEIIQEHENIVDDNAANAKSSLAKNCKELKQTGITQSGVYLIDPDGLGSFNVSCDMIIDGGGWTVFQRRMDGSVDFYLGWDKYKNGFRNMSGEFWLGLDKIHRLTKNDETELRVDLEDFEGNKSFAKYKVFKVDAENQNYKLTVGNFTGDAGDSLSYHNGMKFSTKDKDNDVYPTGSCAVAYKGAWWYRSCFSSNLNGEYYHSAHDAYAEGVIWVAWKGNSYSLKKTEMKIRPQKP